MGANKKNVIVVLFGMGLIGFAPAALAATSSDSQVAGVNGSKVAGMRRLTEEEYRNTVADIFGPEIKVEGSFEQAPRIGGLLSASSSILSITSSGFASYSEIAANVAQQVMDEKNRAKFISCTPKVATAPDDACATQVLDHYGALLFRRPLTKDELVEHVTMANKLATSSKNFYTGLRYALASYLDAPDFLFRVNVASSADGKNYTLDNYSRATQLSYFLWDTTPDAELTRAAQAGELTTPTGLNKQVDRMLASPHLTNGVRAFFTDMLELSGASSLAGADFDTKDTLIYPQWTTQIAADAKEETLRDVVDLTLTHNGDLRDLMTTRKTFINRPLASVYGVPYNFTGDWSSYEFTPDSGRSGLLTQISMLRTSHSGRSSPTERGVMLLDVFLCLPTPPPPPNVDFSIVNDTSSLKTVRERLTAHRANPACASCHSHMDPIGLTLENFESTGASRALENGKPVDVSGTYSGTGPHAGKPINGAVDLGKAMHDDPKFTTCVARKVFAYGTGQDAYTEVGPAKYRDVYQAFVNSGYRLKPLLKAISTTPAFFAATIPTAEANSGSKQQQKAAQGNDKQQKAG